jgi:hypothetical protein
MVCPNPRSGNPERTVNKLKGPEMIVLGVILMLLALLLDIGLLYTIGGILIVVGAILWILGAMGRQIGPRAHYY